MGLFSLDRLVVIFPEEAKGGGAGLGTWRSGLQALKVPVQAPSASSGDKLLEFRVWSALALCVTWGELCNFFVSYDLICLFLEVITVPASPQ